MDDFPFVFHTVDRCREILRRGGIKICREVASDGVSERLKDLINGMDEATYQQYITDTVWQISCGKARPCLFFCEISKKVFDD